MNAVHVIPLSEDALEEIWKRHRDAVTRARHSLNAPFSQAEIDRRILLVHVKHLEEVLARMDLELIETTGQLHDLQDATPGL